MPRMLNWAILFSERLGVYAWRLIAAWTLLVAVLAWSSWVRHESQIRDRARVEARTHITKDQAIRFWATSHGGVYVPTDDRTPPNPHLAHVPERDITTPSGKALTLMNPAYILRQVTQDYSDVYGVKGHITSLCDPVMPPTLGSTQRWSPSNSVRPRCSSLRISTGSRTCDSCGRS